MDGEIEKENPRDVREPSPTMGETERLAARAASALVGTDSTNGSASATGQQSETLELHLTILRASIEHAFENIKFIDQKATVLATIIGAFALKFFEILASKWMVLGVHAQSFFAAAILALMSALASCLLVLVPQGYKFSDMHTAPGMEFLDPDRTRTVGRNQGLRAEKMRALSPDAWRLAYTTVLFNRGLNAERKAKFTKYAVRLALGALGACAVGVGVYILHL